jgi:hypothetical protein
MDFTTKNEYPREISIANAKRPRLNIPCFDSKDELDSHIESDAFLSAMKSAGNTMFSSCANYVPIVVQKKMGEERLYILFMI